MSFHEERLTCINYLNRLINSYIAGTKHTMENYKTPQNLNHMSKFLISFKLPTNILLTRNLPPFQMNLKLQIYNFGSPNHSLQMQTNIVKMNQD